TTTQRTGRAFLLAMSPETHRVVRDGQQLVVDTGAGVGPPGQGAGHRAGRLGGDRGPEPAAAGGGSAHRSRAFAGTNGRGGELAGEPGVLAVASGVRSGESTPAGVDLVPADGALERSVADRLLVHGWGIQRPLPGPDP